jgi:hypothetical protein
MSKHRAYAVKIRKQRAMRRRCIVSVFSILAAFYISAVGSILFTNAHGNASEDPVVGKYYKSIQIQKGDTLQSLADTYAKDSDKRQLLDTLRK